MRKKFLNETGNEIWYIVENAVHNYVHPGVIIGKDIFNSTWSRFKKGKMDFITLNPIRTDINYNFIKPNKH